MGTSIVSFLRNLHTHSTVGKLIYIFYPQEIKILFHPHFWYLLCFISLVEAIVPGVRSISVILICSFLMIKQAFQKFIGYLHLLIWLNTVLFSSSIFGHLYFNRKVFGFLHHFLLDNLFFEKRIFGQNSYDFFFSSLYIVYINHLSDE